MKIQEERYQAVAKYLPYSPYKLRPIADVIRGKNAKDAINWLKIYHNKRTVPVEKALMSALANAIDRKCPGTESEMIVSEIKIDQGPVRKYFKPGAQGRSTVLRRRFSHITVVVELKAKNKGSLYGSKG